jgi:hypothetical protein
MKCAATRSAGTAFVLCIVALGRASAARAQAASSSPDATLPRCVEAQAVMLTKLDSATTNAGDSFAFKVTARVPASTGNPVITAGTRGFGIVSFADHAHGAGQPGKLVVEPRFLRLPDGTHVQVLADPQAADNFVQGSTRDLNGALGFVPGLGLAVGGYNALHRGKEVSIAKGTAFSLIVGDQLAAGECYVAPPSELNVR